MTLRSAALAVVLAVGGLASVACGGALPGPPTNLPVPQNSTKIGPGDVFEVSVVGEKDFSKDYRVNPDGTIDFPYIDRLTVTGEEPQQVARLIQEALVSKKILSNPQVSVAVKSYSQKRVRVIGQVTKPDSYSWNEGLTLVDAISRAGWFSGLADTHHVILTRHTNDGKIVRVVVDVDAMAEGTQADVLLQAGDTIKVEQRVL